MQTGEGTRRERRLSPAWLVAVAALIAALGGTAVAVDKITSKDIARNAVRSKHIKAGQVKTADADVVKYRKAIPAVVTENTASVNAGPVITGRAKPGDLLHIEARADIERLSGAAGCGVFLGVQNNDGESGSNVMTASSPTPQTRWINQGSSGTAAKHEAIARTVPVSTGGTYRVSLRYYSGDGSTDCSFTNRQVWVEHSR